MLRPISKVAPEWWDYTTLDAELLACAELGPDAVMVPICEAAWAQSRSRFPGPYDEEDVSSACTPHILRVEGP